MYSLHVTCYPACFSSYPVRRRHHTEACRRRCDAVAGRHHRVLPAPAGISTGVSPTGAPCTAAGWRVLGPVGAPARRPLELHSPSADALLHGSTRVPALLIGAPRPAGAPAHRLPLASEKKWKMLRFNIFKIFFNITYFECLLNIFKY